MTLTSMNRTGPDGPGAERAHPRRTAQQATQGYELVVVDTWASIGRLLPEWRDLYEHSTAASQCSAPDLLLAWARQHSNVAPQVVAVRSDRGLEAAAAFSTRRIAGIRILYLLGTEHKAQMIELPEILTRAGAPCRKVVGRILSWAAAPGRGVHWAAVSVGDDQHWPEGSWALPTLSIQKTTRASVVLPLVAADWMGPLPKVKRNLRESLRRGRNRLDRTGLAWRVEVTSDVQPGYPAAFADLADLHRQRSLLPGPHHPDLFTRPEFARLLRGFVGSSASTRLEIRRLLLDERPIAALLTLRDSTGLWISVSGVGAEGWEFSAVTLLQADAIRAAALDGLPKATFSVGVDDSKLRWSEEVRRSHEFLLVRSDLFTRVVFSAYWLGCAVFQLRRQFARAVR